jgi:hypothetical protein
VSTSHTYYAVWLKFRTKGLKNNDVEQLGQNWRREDHNFSMFIDEITLTHEP